MAPSSVQSLSTLLHNEILLYNLNLLNLLSTWKKMILLLITELSIKPLEAGIRAKTSCRHLHRSVGPTTGTQLAEEGGPKKSGWSINWSLTLPSKSLGNLCTAPYPSNTKYQCSCCEFVLGKSNIDTRGLWMVYLSEQDRYNNDLNYQEVVKKTIFWIKIKEAP